MSNEQKQTKKDKRVNNTSKPKFDYNSPYFYRAIESLASRGYTDRDIAQNLLAGIEDVVQRDVDTNQINKNDADKILASMKGEELCPQKLSEYRNEIDEDGNKTERAEKICDAITRGRSTVNLAVRSTYLQLALGTRKVKSVISRKIRTPEGLETGSTELQTTEQEIAPNIQALSTWLFNNDPEWKEQVLAGKRLDLTTNGKDINNVARQLTPKEAKEYLRKLNERC